MKRTDDKGLVSVGRALVESSPANPTWPYLRRFDDRHEFLAHAAFRCSDENAIIVERSTSDGQQRYGLARIREVTYTMWGRAYKQGEARISFQFVERRDDELDAWSSWSRWMPRSTEPPFRCPEDSLLRLIQHLGLPFTMTR